MQRLLLVLMTSLALSACGLGETATTATAAAAQAKEGLKTEERVKQELEAAATLEAQRRDDAETRSQYARCVVHASQGSA